MRRTCALATQCCAYWLVALFLQSPVHWDCQQGYSCKHRTRRLSQESEPLGMGVYGGPQPPNGRDDLRERLSSLPHCRRQRTPQTVYAFGVRGTCARGRQLFAGHLPIAVRQCGGPRTHPLLQLFSHKTNTMSAERQEGPTESTESHSILAQPEHSVDPAKPNTLTQLVNAKTSTHLACNHY